MRRAVSDLRAGDRVLIDGKWETLARPPFMTPNPEMRIHRTRGVPYVEAAASVLTTANRVLTVWDERVRVESRWDWWVGNRLWGRSRQRA